MVKLGALKSFFEPKRDRVGLYALLGLGFILLVGHFCVAAISIEFVYGRSALLTPTKLYITLASGLALVCLATIPFVQKLKSTPKLIGFVFIVGLTARALMFFSSPVLEDDWHRYLWDGAVVATGGDPYEFAPAEATPVTRLGDEIDWSDDPDLLRLQELTEEDFETYWRINYPYFKTIYPPIAQGGFALAHLIAPFELSGWRTVLLLVDVATFTLLIWTLGLYGRSPLWATLYWWSPVVTLEVFNAGHMDGLIVPFLIGTLALAKLGKIRSAVIALAGAAAVKLWPALLAPALVRKWMFRPRPLIGLAALFIAVTGLLLWPQLHHVFGYVPGEGFGIIDPDQGLVAYSEAWRRHAFLFAVFADGPFAGLEEPDRMARNLSAILIASGALYIAWKRGVEVHKLPETLLFVTVLLLLLSPTGYPWYQVWIAGFIPFAPRWGALGLMVLAPLYYTRFLYGDADPFYQWCVVPIAFGIPILLFAVEPLFRDKAEHGQSDHPKDLRHYSSLE
ncbi:MAG: hypothetical protein AAFV54_03750 [Pseudomonadota bacterium]